MFPLFTQLWYCIDMLYHTSIVVFDPSHKYGQLHQLTVAWFASRFAQMCIDNSIDICVADAQCAVPQSQRLLGHGFPGFSGIWCRSSMVKKFVGLEKDEMVCKLVIFEAPTPQKRLGYSMIQPTPMVLYPSLSKLTVEYFMFNLHIWLPEDVWVYYPDLKPIEDHIYLTAFGLLPGRPKARVVGMAD